METPPDIPLERVVALILDRVPQVQGIYLFGSFSTGDAHPESDLDLALLLPAGLIFQPSLVVALTQDLSEETGRDIDLILLREANSVLQNEVVTNGRVLLARDERAVGEFEMLSLSLWQKLNEERAGILSDIARTGSVLAHERRDGARS